jgi:antitoxin PrlF
MGHLKRCLDFRAPYVKVRRKEFMNLATISSKGQITIPSAVRSALRLDAGDRIEFVEVVPGRFEFFPVTRNIRELKGMFGKTKKTVSIKEMNAAIRARGASAK